MEHFWKEANIQALHERQQRSRFTLIPDAIRCDNITGDHIASKRPKRDNSTWLERGVGTV